MHTGGDRPAARSEVDDDTLMSRDPGLVEAIGNFEGPPLTLAPAPHSWVQVRNSEMNGEFIAKSMRAPGAFGASGKSDSGPILMRLSRLGAARSESNLNSPSHARLISLCWGHRAPSQAQPGPLQGGSRVCSSGRACISCR